MNTAKKMEFQSQCYQVFWPAVLLSERAEAKSKELEILYDGFARSFQATLVGVLNEVKRSRAKDKIQVVELMHDQKMPPGIKLSYRIEGQNLYICDIWLPIQPTLF
ncbi:MAG: hypothetical protein IT206_00675 [Fimbriimonadaceae bacterium]|nr:hypothetical protein [Fimbriimonadaceae bacterium]